MPCLQWLCWNFVPCEIFSVVTRLLHNYPDEPHLFCYFPILKSCLICSLFIKLFHVLCFYALSVSGVFAPCFCQPSHQCNYLLLPNMLHLFSIVFPLHIYYPFPCVLCQTIAHPLVSLSSLCSSRVFLAYVRHFILWPCLLHEPWIDCFQIGDYCLFFDHYSTQRFCTSASANIIYFTENPCCQILILEFSSLLTHINLFSTAGTFPFNWNFENPPHISTEITWIKKKKHPKLSLKNIPGRE